MDSIFKISKSGTYGIVVEGLEIDNSEYIPVDGIRSSIRNYMYADSVTINTLSSLSSTGVETFISHAINIHNNATDSTPFILTKDGLYLISHIILPNRTWLDYMLATYPADLTAYNLIYYYNVSLNKFYKYAAGVHTEVLLSEIIAANYTWSGNVAEQTSTIIRSDKNTFIMYYLNECFAKITKELLLSLPNLSCTDKSTYNQRIFNRDLLWMTINVIKYNIELLQLYEAQRILESVTLCSDICSGSTTNYFNTCGCNN